MAVARHFGNQHIACGERARAGDARTSFDGAERLSFKRCTDAPRRFWAARDQPSRPDSDTMIAIEAEPYAFEFDPTHTALLIIDMQRDFLEPGGFGEMLGNDVSQLRRTIEPNQRLLAAWRAAGLMVMHTREGHRPDLADLPPAKKVRGRSATCIGDAGPMGRILVRGEAGHDIISELYPAPGEPVIDKPGKGAFFATDLHAILQNSGITRLVVTGVTTEVCVNTTVREANDRGYDCFVPADCVGSYFPEFQEMGLKMIKAQGGIFGWVGNSEAVIAALKQ
jgi:biuret amidohydrolase